MRGLSIKNLGLSLGIISAIFMIILGILGNFGLYLGAIEMMTMWHNFFDLSLTGIIFGAIEAFVCGGVIGMAIATFYNIMEGR